MNMDSMGLISCISKPYVNCGQSSMLLATILCGLVDNLHKAHWEGANIGINNGTTQQQFTYAKSFEQKGTIMGGEIYSGWLTHWGDEWAGSGLDVFRAQYEFLMRSNYSFSVYVAHGGSNFGLTAGADPRKASSGDYRPHITSYDYDAPINEQGSTTEKYTIFRELAKKYATWDIPDIPLPIPRITIAPFMLRKQGNLFGNLPQPTVANSKVPYLFESNELQMFGQGIVVYQTNLSQQDHTIELIVHDFGVIYLEDQFIRFVNRSASVNHEFNISCKDIVCRLFLVVEAMGHINFDHEIETDWKGLIKFKSNTQNNFKWNIYNIPIKDTPVNWSTPASTKPYPCLLMGQITLTEVGDTYLDLSAYGKGYVWVNDHNLGRYWNIGPQQRVFCPGVWLNKGSNTIRVLQMTKDDQRLISGQLTLK